METQYPELIKSIKFTRGIADTIINATKTKVEIEYQNKVGGTELLEEMTKTLNKSYPELNLYAFRDYLGDIETISIWTNKHKNNFKISIDLSSLRENLIKIDSMIAEYHFYFPLTDPEVSLLVENMKVDVLNMIKEMPRYRLYFVTNEIKIKG